MNQKKENVILSQFCMGTKLLLDVGVCAALFRRKIWTKGGWYFLLVALYYCKIFNSHTEQHFCLEITPRSTENLKPKHKTVCWFRVHTSFGISPAFPYASIKNDVMWSTQAKKQEETNLYLCLLAFMSTHYSPLIPLLNFFTRPGLFFRQKDTLKVHN